MRRSEILQLNETATANVLQHLERAYPGVLVQGDTIWILFRHATEVYSRLRENESSDLAWHAFKIAESLHSLLMLYEQSLHVERIPLPYTSSVADASPVPPSEE